MTKVLEKLGSSYVSRKDTDNLQLTTQVLHNTDVKVYKMYGNIGDSSVHNTVKKRRAEGTPAHIVPHRVGVVTKGSLKVTLRDPETDEVLFTEVRQVGDFGGAMHDLVGIITFEPQEDDTQWHCIFTTGRYQHTPFFRQIVADRTIPLPDGADDQLTVVLEGRVRVGDVEYDAPFSFQDLPGEPRERITSASPVTIVRLNARKDPDE